MKEKYSNKPNIDKVQREKKSKKHSEMPSKIYFTDNETKQQNKNTKKKQTYDYINLDNNFLKEYFNHK